MTVSPFDEQANRVMEPLRKFAGSATGEDLDKLMLELTNGKRYRLELEFVHDIADETESIQYGRSLDINRELDLYKNGKNPAKRLNYILRCYIKHAYPGYGVADVKVLGIEHGWPRIYIDFHDIVGAYKFACMFDGKELPEQYSITDLGKSVTFLYSLWPEFTWNRAAANKLGLVPDSSGNNV